MNKMFDHGVAIERWDFDKRQNVEDWLETTFGKGDRNGRWFIDYDFNLWTLCMDPDVYTMYLLKFYEILEQE